LGPVLLVVDYSSRKFRSVNELRSWSRRGSVLEYLGERMGEELLSRRRRVAESIPDRRGYLHSSVPGPDLGFDTQSRAVTYLPAYMRYREGRMYRGLPWPVIAGCRDLDVVFVSPLYGIARHLELIRCYDIALPTARRAFGPGDVWGDFIVKAVASYAVSRGADVVYDLASEKLRRAFLAGLRRTVMGRGVKYVRERLGSSFSEVSVNIRSKIAYLARRYCSA